MLAGLLDCSCKMIASCLPDRLPGVCPPRLAACPPVLALQPLPPQGQALQCKMVPLEELPKSTTSCLVRQCSVLTVATCMHGNVAQQHLY